MGKLVKHCLLAFFVAMLGVSTAQAAKTKFTNVEVTGTLDVDGAMTTGSCTCTNISTSAFTAASVTATGTAAANQVTATTSVTASSATFTSTTKPLTLSGSITATAAPAAVNMLGFDASHILYVSTSTNAGGWQKASGQ